MSEQENTPPQQPSALSQAVESTIPQQPPTGTFNYLDEHTPSNTPLNTLMDPVSESKRSGVSEDHREGGYTTAFLGNTKEEIKQAQDLLGKWLGLQSARELHKADQISKSVVLAAENDWKQYIETNYPGQPLALFEQRAVDLYRFFDGLQDSLLVRTRLVREDQITNVSKRADGLVAPDIMGRVPGSSMQGFSVSEMMERSALRATKQSYQYDVLLRNSFLKLVFVRPNKLELANLINDINRTVRGYVRQVGGNSQQLATVAGVKAVWEWFAPRIISSSVSGVLDFRDLANVIRLTDFNTLCNAILASVADEGIHMDIRCFNLACDHYTFDLIDPTKLTQIRHWVQTPEENAILGNIANGRKHYTVEEILELIGRSTYGLDNTSVWSANEGIKLGIAPPSLTDAFLTFDYFVGEIDPKLAEIRSKVIGEAELEQQIQVMLNGLGAAEYIHWVDTYTIMPDPGSDDEPFVLHRAKCNSDEFNAGLMKALKADSVLNRNLTHFVYNKSILMTRTFSGIRNRVCPKCGKHSTSAQEEGMQLGYTPINSFMNFFTHTQLILMNLAVARQADVKEALS